jgi:hypothetical protein
MRGREQRGGEGGRSTTAEGHCDNSGLVVNRNKSFNSLEEWLDMSAKKDNGACGKSSTINPGSRRQDPGKLKIP